MWHWSSLVAQTVKNLPAMQETRVWPPGQEDPLEKGMTATPVFLPAEFHGESSLAGYSPWGLQRAGHNWAANTHTPCAIDCSGSLKISLSVLRMWILLSSFYKFELQAERVTSLLKRSQLQNYHSWVPETEFFWFPGSSFSALHQVLSSEVTLLCL